MKPTAAITGMHIRMDVKTKCTVVESILTQTFADKEALNAFINIQALKLDVNPVTIKLWCSKYADIFLIGKQLPAGVMSFVVDPLDQSAINKVRPQLESIRSSLSTLKAKYHAPQPRTSQEILEELIATFGK
jgi:hypothetical protein